MPRKIGGSNEEDIRHLINIVVGSGRVVIVKSIYGVSGKAKIIQREDSENTPMC